MSTSENKSQHTSDTIKTFTLESLQAITNNFSEEHIIGLGGYGTVYKGVLDNGEEIALKKLHYMPGFDDKAFSNEFSNLMKARHKNITRLVGYCYHTGHQIVEHNGGHIFALVEERVLCIEYMHNGSLDKYLSDESCGLDWCTRYTIINGVCEGLNYLHTGYKDPIYHLDLKPANILLDKDMTPKIGDFGLSRLFAGEHTYVTTKTTGTRGYMPPEYIERGEITNKFDVFSLGVIMIKIIAGDKGYSTCPNFSSQQFVEHVHENWKKRPGEIMSSRTSEEVITCLEIALECVEVDRVRRPTISEVVTLLNKINCVKSSPMSEDDLEPFGYVGSLDDNVESFLSNDDGDARDMFSALKRSPTEPNPAASKGFTFSEFNCCRTSNRKVVCCNFSYDGKILASAGHEKKVVLWNMDTFQTHYLPEEHTSIITDVRFRPISTQMATSSFDGTIKLWNAADPGCSQITFARHNCHVTSLDFHPKKTDLLCSCDGNGEIQYWDVTLLTCVHVVKPDYFSRTLLTSVRVIEGATAQVCFQPNTGQFIAAASENVVSIFDVDTQTKKYFLQGHNTDVQSVCWDNTGEYLASVSQDLVKVWSISSGECIHEVSSKGNNKFFSCVFHPSYTNLLVIGGYQSLELWNMVKNQSMTVQAHEGLIASLAQSPVTGMVASTSHDSSVKLWK